jgi:protein-S-isoprenylcysteine O-methyltransferase Ste14
MSGALYNPGVRFPPPFLYALAVAGGLLLNRWWPLAIGWPTVATSIGVALGAAGFVLMFGGIGAFWRSRTSIIPVRPASTLVVAGPYRFTRNPMYVGLAAVTVALGLILDTWWPILLLPSALFLVQRLVIAREERYLLRRFPGQYEAYMRRVRRWL